MVIVNREAITQSQLTREMEHAPQQLEHAHQPIPALSELRRQVLDNLINKNLQLQLCKANGLKMPDEEINNAIQNIAKSNKITVAQLKEAIGQTGLTFDEYKSEIHEQLLLQKLQQEQAVKNISFTPDDVKKYMRENKDKFNRYSTYHVIDIVLPSAEGTTASQIEQVKKQASNLATQLQTGKDLDIAIKQYPAAEKNDLGWRGLADYPSLFQSKIAALKINNTSAPIQAPNGFHVLQLTGAKGDSVQPTETEIKNIVFQQKAQEAIKDWLANLRKDAYVKIIN